QAAPDAIETGGALRERLAALARSLDPDDVQLFYQITIHGREDLPLAPDDFAGFTMALLRMLAFATAQQPGAKAAKRPEPSRGAQPAGFDGDWPRLANSLNLGGIAKQLAQSSELQRFDGESLELCVPPAAKQLAEKTFQDKLRGALQEHFGRPVRLAVRVGETGGDTPRDLAPTPIGQGASIVDPPQNFESPLLHST